MVDANLKYANDPQLLLDIVSAMPKRVDNTLTLHRNKLLGNAPKHRNDFIPANLLSRVDGGNKILVMDSLQDLPENWRDIDLKEKYGIANREEGVEPQHEPDTQSSGVSDAVSESDEEQGEAAGGSDSEDSDRDPENVDATVHAEHGKTPKRVLVFSSVMLLGLLAMCRWGSVDGTLKIR